MTGVMFDQLPIHFNNKDYDLQSKVTIRAKNVPSTVRQYIVGMINKRLVDIDDTETATWEGRRYQTELATEVGGFIPPLYALD